MQAGEPEVSAPEYFSCSIPETDGGGPASTSASITTKRGLDNQEDKVSSEGLIGHVSAAVQTMQSGDGDTQTSKPKRKKSKAERIQEKAAALNGPFDLFDGIDSTSIVLPLSWKGQEAKQRVVESLLPGLVLIRNFLTPQHQQRVVDVLQSLGAGPGGFYKPEYASGAKCRLHMMCLGLHWNLKTEKYDSIRSNFDNAPVPPVPQEFHHLVQSCVEIARNHDPEVMGTAESIDPSLCVVNFYNGHGRNGLHKDKDESEATIQKGSPVVSFSIGAAAEFAYCLELPEKGSGTAVPVVRLESGDALLFGGPSRLIVHALTRVYSGTEPDWLRMRKGRLNLTFREY